MRYSVGCFFVSRIACKIKTREVFLPLIKLNSLLAWHYSPVLTFLCFIVDVF